MIGPGWSRVDSAHVWGRRARLQRFLPGLPRFGVFLAILLVAIIGQVAVRGMAARNTPAYPCAFQQKVNSRWVGQLSLQDAERIRLKSVRLGELVAPVRLNEVTQADVPAMIVCVAKAHRTPPGPFLEVADCEGDLHPKQVSPNGLYHSIFQYDRPTWESSSREYGHAGASIYDGYAQINVTVQKVEAEGWDAWGSCA